MKYIILIILLLFIISCSLDRTNPLDPLVSDINAPNKVKLCVSILIIPIGILHYRVSSKTCKMCKLKEIPGKCPEDYSFL